MFLLQIWRKGDCRKTIELSCRIDNQADCKQILEWFNNIFDKADKITEDFIEIYRPYFEKWNKYASLQKKEHAEVYQEVEISLNKEKLTAYLRKWRNSSYYGVVCKERQQAVKDLRKALDYENDFKSIDIDAFLAIDALGKIRQSYKKDLKVAVKDSSLKKLCRMLCDDTLSTAKKYEYAFTKYRVRGCGKNIITKILAVHNPKEYFVWNKAIDDVLKKFEFQCSKNKEWNKYAKFCDFFKSINQEVDIKNFAVLDYGLSEMNWTQKA